MLRVAPRESRRGVRSRVARGLAAFVMALLSLSAPAGATYSVVGVDRLTGEVGAAGASCVPYEVIRIYASVPAKGALVAQANFDDLALTAATQALFQGKSAAETLALVTDAAVFPMASLMQYGIVDVDGGVASYTGQNATQVADDRVGAADRFRFAVQGNYLTSTAVLTQAEVGFQGCDLAERLVSALEAASVGGEGDARCTPDGVPAKSAFVDVTGLHGTVFRVSVPDVGPESPIPLLRSAWTTFRAEHPCPEVVSGQLAPPAMTPPVDASCTAFAPGEPRRRPGAVLTLVALALAVWARRRGRSHRGGRAHRPSREPKTRLPADRRPAGSASERTESPAALRPCVAVSCSRTRRSSCYRSR